MNGILLVDKPSDWTSFDVVNKLKRVYHTGRIGHSGTLDPMATGLLVVFIGRATRAVEYAEADRKRYIASLRLGVTTDTQDTTGHILTEKPVNVDKDQLLEAISAFTGTYTQIPPMYSAIKVNGQRLYDIARRGGEVERKGREVTVYRAGLSGQSGGDYVLDVTCSKGTYIRTLCHDIGAHLGCGGCMSALRRVSAGMFSVENAHTMDEILSLAAEGREESLLLGTDSLFAALPAVTLEEAGEKKLKCGSALQTDCPDGRYRAYSRNGEFLAVAAVHSGELKAEKSFFEV